jgi:hypothetical protein
MLFQVMKEIKKTNGNIRLGELYQKLGIERSALDGMIQFLIQTGHLVDENISQESDTIQLCGKCSSSCLAVSRFDSSGIGIKPLFSEEERVANAER